MFYDLLAEADADGLGRGDCADESCEADESDVTVRLEDVGLDWSLPKSDGDCRLCDEVVVLSGWEVGEDILLLHTHPHDDRSLLLKH